MFLCIQRRNSDQKNTMGKKGWYGISDWSGGSGQLNDCRGEGLEWD